MMIEEKDNYSVLMNYLTYIRQSIDALDPYSKNIRRIANHGIHILVEEYKDKKWKVQKFQSQMNLPKEFYIYQPDVDFKEYDRDTTDKLPDFFVVTTGKGADRINESAYFEKNTPKKAPPQPGHDQSDSEMTEEKANQEAEAEEAEAEEKEEEEKVVKKVTKKKATQRGKKKVVEEEDDNQESEKDDNTVQNEKENEDDEEQDKDVQMKDTAAVAQEEEEREEEEL
ncbi:hypothetical protein PPL_00891 [Heterostelium album PN500]|uniref:Uncharacterized protein n=1 Tax=Heterostelium pallidum (strain ATCC 26659 / Pp 5 / PN500) TaxID=670386 RepID=D3AYX2_HETP5|nr:hypothetical protein PPL_00891 [Heterostelium album PN500]EFA85662.1 hypothetical protein PPL_00891 [Heterostelium album PN500]|eukprot:XP_020437769.1 hypothetical protein PPL_00891 [Heterostelium album PN500]